MKNTTSSLRRVRLPRTPADWLEAVMNFIFFLCGMLAVCCVVLISVYMVVSGVPAIHKIGIFKFLFGTKWASTAAEPLFGILPFILSSVYGTLGATGLYLFQDILEVRYLELVLILSILAFDHAVQPLFV